MFKTSSEKLIRCSPLRNLCCLSTIAQPLTESRLNTFRTGETDPTNHSSEHLAQFYNLPTNDKKCLFLHGGLPTSFETQAKTFNETSIMIREPALDVISCLKNIDFSKPAVRFVLYGKKGSGKSITLAHVLHYAHKNKFLIMHVPWVGNWMRRCKESSVSETREGFINLNLDAASWLLHFKTQNAELLKSPELIIDKEINWSKREVTSKGSSLLEVVEHGISRIKFASDCVTVVADQVKKFSNSGVCRTLVAIDGFNAFFYPKTRIFTDKKELVHPEKVVLTEAFINLTKFDWKNSAIVVTVDEIAIAEEDHLSYLPRYLLGKKGFEHMDPFVPIPVPDYSEKEVVSCMNYYRDRKWVNPYPGQDTELAFLSAHNPYKLMELCASL